MTETAISPEAQLSDNDVQAIDQLRDVYHRLRQELARVIVGQRDVIEELSICLFARGHALLMGVPGLAKTLLVSKLAETMSLKFSRIQYISRAQDICLNRFHREKLTGRNVFQSCCMKNKINAFHVIKHFFSVPNIPNNEL